MSSRNIRRALLVLATVCFVLTIVYTEHVFPAAVVGLSLGYCLGITRPADPRF